jgi:hypothetical protein
VAGVAGRLLPQAEEDALEAFAELAVTNRRALPIVSGLVTRTIIGPRGPMMSPAARRAAVRTVTQAARTLVQRGGPPAIRALPRIARTVRRTAAARGTPASARPQVVRRTASRVAANPRLAQRLARPLRRGQRIARAAIGRAGGRGLAGRTFRPLGSGGSLLGNGRMGWPPGRAVRLRGPVEITIRSA